jgi:hypothetical protein
MTDRYRCGARAPFLYSNLFGRPRRHGRLRGHPYPVAAPSGQTKARPSRARRIKKTRQRPTLPLSCPSSTIGTGGLNFRVRNGNGCFPAVMVTGIY